MSELLASYAVLGLGALVAVFVWWRRPYRLRRKVVVTTKDRQTLEGVLARVYPGALILHGAKLLADEHPEGIPLDGQVLVERGNVSFVQRVD